MSSVAKPSLRKLDFTAASKIVEEHAQEQGIPTLVKPGSVTQLTPAAPAQAQAQAQAQEVTPPAEPSNPSKPAAKKGKGTRTSEAAHQTPVKRLAVDLPLYLITEIRQRAATEDTTIRFIITRALSKDKFKVEPQDLIEDGRREH